MKYMNQNRIMSLILKKGMIYLIIIPAFFLLQDKSVQTMELNLLCIKNDSDNNERTVKDLILQINTDTNDIRLGGLSFKASSLKITETNLKWEASDVADMYTDSSGYTSGNLGRFSGELNLFFRHDISKKKISLNYTCEKYKLRNRKF